MHNNIKILSHLSSVRIVPS